MLNYHSSLICWYSWFSPNRYFNQTLEYVNSFLFSFSLIFCLCVLHRLTVFIFVDFFTNQKKVRAFFFFFKYCVTESKSKISFSFKILKTFYMYLVWGFVCLCLCVEVRQHAGDSSLPPPGLFWWQDSDLTAATLPLLCNTTQWIFFHVCAYIYF